MRILSSYQYPLKTIELAGRTCYQSQEAITEESACKFVEKITKLGHLSVIEHSRVVVEIPEEKDAATVLMVIGLEGPEVAVSSLKETLIVSGNYRAWKNLLSAIQSHCALFRNKDSITEIEDLLIGHSSTIFGEGLSPKLEPPLPKAQLASVPQGSMSDALLPNYGGTRAELIDYCIPTKVPNRHGAMTVKIQGASRAYTHEQVRHRKASYSQQSQRYVDESCFPFVIPKEVKQLSPKALATYADAINTTKTAYKYLQDAGCKKQIARYVLPNATKSEIVITMTWEWWKHFFKLRCSPKAQPEMQEVAGLIRDLAKHVYPSMDL